MANKIPCEIIQDLLPSYMDGLTNEVTNHAVETHVETCESCRDTLYAMKTPVEPENKPEEIQEEKQEIDFLRKTRRKSIKIVVGSVVCAVVIVFVAIFANLYLIGEPVDPYIISCTASAEGNLAHIEGRLLESGQGISMIDRKVEDGVVTYTFESKTNTLLKQKPDGFSLTFDAEEPVKQIRIDDRIVWDNGVEISSITSQVYQTKHDYVGDMPANGETANALLMFQEFEYTNELQTTEEPYGWTFLLAEVYPTSEERLDEKMTGYAYVLMAMIGNLEVVTFENPDGSGLVSYTAEDATKAMGRDIKSYGETPAKLQILMEAVGLADDNNSRINSADECIDISIINEAADEVSMISMDYYLDGELIGSGGVVHADGTLLSPEESINFSLLPEYFSNKILTEDSKIEVAFTIYDENEVEYPIAEKIALQANFEYDYSWVLFGNGKSGYKIIN